MVLAWNYCQVISRMPVIVEADDEMLSRCANSVRCMCQKRNEQRMGLLKIWKPAAPKKWRPRKYQGVSLRLRVIA
jgi:hypothetical protein